MSIGMGDLCSDCNIFVTHCKTIVDGNGIVRGLPPRSNSPAILKSIGCMHCIRIGIIALIALCIGARFTSASRPSLLKLRSALPATVLRPLWWDVCRMPLEMLGYSFADDYEEMLQMHAEGANAVGMGAMWHPIRAPNEPYGVGALPPYTLLGAERLAQTFRTNVRIKGLAVHTPTWFTNDAAFTLRVYRIGRNGCLMQIAQKRFTNVPDNAWCTIEFAPQPPGRYLWEMVDGKGRIGAWAKWGNVYVYGDAFLGGNRALDIDFETRLVLTNGASAELFVTGDPHVSVPLGWGRINTVEQLGMRTNFSVGNWNNGHFPYYPDWFFKRYPDVAMLDQHGNSFMAGMFGKRYPWGAIDHPVIVSGTQRFIRKTVAMLK
ncbi:MAG TPA: hypothetical protein EYP10_06615, partial [Armatimonadetes bacterium]|nr:hypothetical protein [Armatimonadota bacterium]